MTVGCHGNRSCLFFYRDGSMSCVCVFFCVIYMKNQSNTWYERSRMFFLRVWSSLLSCLEWDRSGHIHTHSQVSIVYLACFGWYNTFLSFNSCQQRRMDFEQVLGDDHGWCQGSPGVSLSQFGISSTDPENSSSWCPLLCLIIAVQNCLIDKNDDNQTGLNDIIIMKSGSFLSPPCLGSWWEDFGRDPSDKDRVPF